MIVKQKGLNSWYTMEEEKLCVVHSYLKAVPKFKVAVHLSQTEYCLITPSL